MTLLDSTAWQLLGHTALLVLATLAVSLPLGTLLAVLLVRTNLPLRRLWLAVLGMQLFVPLYVHAAAWDSGFGVTGWFTTLVGGETVWLEAFRGAVWIHVVSALPWVVLIVGCGTWFVEPELEEDALLHTSAGEVLFRVTLRRALPAVGIAALWVAAMTAGEITATDLFRVRTFAEEIYMALSGGAGSTDALTTVAPLVLIVAGLVLAAVVLLGRMTPRDLPASIRSRPVLTLGSARGWMGAIVAALMSVLIAVPLGSLVFKAGVEVVKVDGDVQRQWSAGVLLDRVWDSGPRFADELQWSFELGFFAATAATLGGLLLAWWLRDVRAGSLPVLAALSAALALPGPLVALGIIFLLNRDLPGLTTLYDQTLLAPWLALIVRTLPWTTLVLWFAVRSVPKDVLDAAAIDGAGSARRLVRIVLPLRRGALLLAWLVAFVLSVGDMAFTVIVLPPGVETISVRIFRLIHAAADSEVAAVCLMLLLAQAAAMLAAAWVLRWELGRQSRESGAA